MRKLLLSSKLHAIIFAVLIYGITGNNIIAQNCESYLGEIPPDSIPVRFGNTYYQSDANWWWHGSPVFSPDGNEMYFTKYIATGGTEIWFSKCENDIWTDPQKTSFSDKTYVDNSPCFAGNDTLYFTSQRSIYGYLFRITRTAGGSWSEPEIFDIPIPAGYGIGNQCSIANSGNIYGELEILGSNNPDIYLWKRNSNGHYASPQKISQISSPQLDFCPDVDPEERFIIFSSRREGGFSDNDLYISYRNQDETWSIPQNMGQTINADGAFQPKVSVDGEYLFFNSLKTGDISVNAYWVKSDQYISFVGITDNLIKPLKDDIQIQNIPNPCHTETTIIFELSKSFIISLELSSVTGIKVDDLIRNKWYPKGKHEINLDISHLQSGIYYYSLFAENGEKSVRKMIIQ